MTESSHPLPWMIGPVGDKHVVKDRDGELVYIGTDVGEVMRPVSSGGRGGE